MGEQGTIGEPLVFHSGPGNFQNGLIIETHSRHPSVDLDTPRGVIVTGDDRLRSIGEVCLLYGIRPGTKSLNDGSHRFTCRR